MSLRLSELDKRRCLVAFWCAAGMASAAELVLTVAALWHVERMIGAGLIGAGPGLSLWWKPGRGIKARSFEAAAWIAGAVFGVWLKMR